MYVTSKIMSSKKLPLNQPKIERKKSPYRIITKRKSEEYRERKNISKCKFITGDFCLTFIRIYTHALTSESTNIIHIS